jgi:hypothetical protein
MRIIKMPKKKIKINKNKNKLSKITNFTTKSLSNVLSNYKKNKELEKIKAIKLKKLEDKNTISREKKDLKKSTPLKVVKKSLKMRTMSDKKRKNSPLIKVKDAILVGSDKLNKKEVLAKMSKAIDKVLKN